MLDIQSIRNPKLRTVAEYAMITAAILFMCVGIYFFKFPNHFAFGGVSGFSPVISALTGISASRFTNIANVVLMILGFLILGKSVGVKTLYATVVMTLGLDAMEKLFPLTGTLTTQPFLELIFAILIPAIASALLFNIGASSGGTDIIAMILRRYTSMNIGKALLVVDIASVTMAFFLFGAETGLYSLLGLASKSLVIDNLIESLNLCKSFTIVSSDPEPICDYIIKELHRSATVYHAHGAFSGEPKTIILTTMKRAQAVHLRTYIKSVEPTAFITIMNSSEIIGKGFNQLT